MQEEIIRKSWADRLKIVFWLLLLIGVGVIVLIAIRGQKLISPSSDLYQVVFLDNDQVYFGKLNAVDEDLWSLTDVYYLRAGPSVLDESGEQERKVDLIKLGTELHQPRDEMFINREHVIFYEDIGEQSVIRQTIREHERK